jgi:hypothetical protein
LYFCTLIVKTKKMQDNKLLQLFSALSGYERKKLRRFLLSPYHNEREDLILLFDHLQNLLKTKSEFDKYAAWRVMYTDNRAYCDADMRCLMTFLLQRIAAFLQAEALAKDASQQHKYLSQAYENYNLPQHAKQNIRQWQQATQKTDLRDNQYLYQIHQYQEAEFASHEDEQRNATRNLQALPDTLEAAFIAARLRQACQLQAHETVYKIEYDKGLLPAVLGFVAARPQLLQLPAVALYYYYYMARQSAENSEPFFNQYTQLLSTSHALFAPDELRDLYRMAINYAIRRANTAEGSHFAPRLFDFYKVGFELGILLEKEKISRFSYKNAVSLAIRLGEFEWAKQFIAAQSARLPDEFRHSYQHYALGKWHFAQNELDKALVFLQKVEYEDVFLNLDARVMQLKIYVQLGEYAALEYFLQAFRTFIRRRQQQLGYHFQNYNHIINFALRLIELPQSPKNKAAQLRHDIEKTQNFTERDWFLLQIQ